MSFRCTHNSTVNLASARETRGLTLVEMMVTMAIFSMVVMGLISAHMFGMRQDQLVNSKLGASDESRRAFNQLAGDIRSAKMWRIGTGSEVAFIPTPNGQPQRGNALHLNLTTDTNAFIRYYFHPASGTLRRVQSGATGFSVTANYLTNTMLFQAEDYLGNLKTELTYKYVVRVIMEFYQYQYPLTKVGPGCYYDRYKMEFKVTPHCPDGA